MPRLLNPAECATLHKAQRVGAQDARGLIRIYCPVCDREEEDDGEVLPFDPAELVREAQRQLGELP